MASKSREPYSYSPLTASRDIRLVTLHPGTGEQEISLAIKHFSLDESPAYDALSYVWGSQYPSYWVSCDNAFLEIGENLRDALQYLRKPDAARVLWIDRIAINQEDLKERAAQVGIMSDIYSSASEVPVWLGRADGGTEQVFLYINDLAQKMLAFWNSEGSKIPKSGEDPRVLSHPIQYLPVDHPVWLAIRAFLQRPWFSRVWTFQEIVLARTPVLICGSSSMKWDMLEAFFLGLMIYPEGPNNEDLRLRGADIYLREITKARLLQHHKDANHPEITQVRLLKHLNQDSNYSEDTQILLLPLLDSLRNRQSSDPRDKVFAALNIAQDIKSSRLSVDYNKSLADVYIMTAHYLLRTKRKLSFLSMVEKKDKPDLISWVPDFRYKDAGTFCTNNNRISEVILRPSTPLEIRMLLS